MQNQGITLSQDDTLRSDFICQADEQSMSNKYCSGTSGAHPSEETGKKIFFPFVCHLPLFNLLMGFELNRNSETIISLTHDDGDDDEVEYHAEIAEPVENLIESFVKVHGM